MSLADVIDATEQLPIHLTGFIGRARELDQLSHLLHSTRLLTLTGAGGSGKTRLAREAAHEAASRFSRVAWIDLAPVTDGALVAQQVAKTLGVTEHARVPTVSRVIDAIADDLLLLVLDNCEHLVEATARLTDDLLRGCRGLTVLATSREALGVIGETAWLVPRLEEDEAVLLFAERARAAMPSFAVTDGNREAVQQICTRLDGIPLAIELAAARVRVLSPKQIAARLDDAFGLLTVSSRMALPRHRTLRSTMEWSHALLSVREQVLLRRLAVFAGSFALEAAESVCADAADADAAVADAAVADAAVADAAVAMPAEADATLESHDVLDGVAALVDKSLVVMEPGDAAARYRLLETVRQYGMERLTEAGEHASLLERHARYYLRFASDVAPMLVGGEHVPGLLARLTRENDNLRVAAAWASADRARAVEALQFADALFWYWYGTGYWLRTGQFDEASRYLASAIANGRGAPPDLLGRVLIAQGLTRLAQGDWADARDAFAEALSLVRPMAHPPTMAIALSKKSAAHLMLGDLPEARALIQEAREWAAQVPIGMVHAFVLYWQGFLELHDRDIEALRISRAEAMRVSRALEQHRTIRAHHSNLMARGELLLGQLDAAAVSLRDAWQLHEIIGDGWGLSHDLEAVSMLLHARGDHEGSVRLIGATDSLRERIAAAMLAIDAPDRARRVADARQQLGARYDAIYAEGFALDSSAVSAHVLQATAQQSAVTGDEPVSGAATHMATHMASHMATHTAMSASSDSGAEMAAVTASDSATPVASLRVRALGPLQVLVHEVPVESSAWGSARPRELLVFLLLHPEGSSKEQVGLALWPDASTSQLRNSFHVTMYRLRKALGGADWIQLHGDRYVVNPALIAEFDVPEFERGVMSLRAALAAREDGAATALEQLVARYRGDLLDGEVIGEWHLPIRARLQRLCVDALMDLGAYHDSGRRDERAADAYQRVLARDPLHETAARALMQALLRTGAREQALRVAQRFTQRLQRELGMTPDAETADLIARLR